MYPFHNNMVRHEMVLDRIAKRQVTQAIVALLLTLPGLLAAENIPGTDITLSPPANFITATSFVGFQQIETFSTIKIAQLEQPYAEALLEANQQRADTSGAPVPDSLSLRVGTREAQLFALTTKISGETFNQWLLIIGDAHRSISITATYPDWAAATMSDPLRESLLSAQWLRSAQQQLFYDLPFVVSETADLKFTKRTANMLILADAPPTGSVQTTTPAMVIGHLTSDTPIIDIKAFSHAQLAKLKTIELVDLVNEGEVKVDGIRAYKITATARSVATGDILSFGQILAFQEYRYLLIHQSVREAAFGAYEAQFAEVVASLRFKQPGSL